jgi:hypothetical protein
VNRLFGVIEWRHRSNVVARITRQIHTSWCDHESSLWRREAQMIDGEDDL